MPGAAVPKLAAAQAAAGTALREPGAKEDNGAVQEPGSKELRSRGWGVAVSRSNTSRSRSSPSLDPGDRGEEPAHMAEQPAPELAPTTQVMAVDGTEAPQPRTARRGSNPTAPARSTEEGRAPQLLSRRSSVLSTLPAPLASRRSSLGTAPGGKRPSIGPWMLHSRVSFSGLPLFQPIPEIRLENTYRMGPDEGCGFNAGRVQRVLERVLAGVLGGTSYSPQGGASLVHSLAELLRGRAKEVVPPRYKLVCHVLLGQHSQQSLLVASRALWDPQSDSFASATFSNASLFAVATVHGVYFE
uniref:TC1D4 protein n=1 Tax=Anas zonorhyncha TaxID=75864 RepID=A0A8B9UAK0_9AVES